MFYILPYFEIHMSPKKIQNDKRQMVSPFWAWPLGFFFIINHLVGPQESAPDQNLQLFVNLGSLVQ